MAMAMGSFVPAFSIKYLILILLVCSVYVCYESNLAYKTQTLSMIQQTQPLPNCLEGAGLKQFLDNFAKDLLAVDS